MGSNFLNIKKINALAAKASAEQKKRIAEERKRNEKERKKLEEENRRRKEERRRIEAMKKEKKARKEEKRVLNMIERKKNQIYERIKYYGMKTTGNVDKDIKTFKSIIKSNESQPKNRNKGHIVSMGGENNASNLTYIHNSTETYTIKKQNVTVTKEHTKAKNINRNNSNEGMAFDRFEYGLD